MTKDEFEALPLERSQSLELDLARCALVVTKVRSYFYSPTGAPTPSKWQIIYIEDEA